MFVPFGLKFHQKANTTQTLSWLPVDTAAAALSDILFDKAPLQLVYHLENPIRQSWQDVVLVLAEELKIGTDNIVPLETWLEAVASAPDTNNPAKALSVFFKDEFVKMSSGSLVLDTSVARKSSPTLRGTGTVGATTIQGYISYWRKIGILG